VGLKIGSLEVDPPVVLAPMAGVTNTAFRRLCRTYGAGLYVSEMVTARALVEGNARTMRMVRFAEDERPRSVQLYGVDPTVMGQAVRRVVDLGVDHVDLNFGCPAAKVTRKGGGAALPVHHVLFAAIVREAVKAAAHVPVSVKLRMGVDDEHLTFLTAGRTAEEEGASAVSLHARTAEQLYSGDARWAAITALKETVRVVVGRGCLGRPWLFGQLAAAFAGEAEPPPPSLGGVMDTMRLHLQLLAELLGEDGACRDFRKHTSWYVTGFPVGAERRRNLSGISTFTDLDRLLDDLDPDTPFPDEARRMKRGHTRGPRPVALPPDWFATADDPRPPVGAELLVSGG
jgi:tRNA-dihydrouridine synthase